MKNKNRKMNLGFNKYKLMRHLISKLINYT